MSNTNSNETIQKRPLYIVFKQQQAPSSETSEPLVSKEEDLGVYRQNLQIRKPEEELVKEHIRRMKG